MLHPLETFCHMGNGSRRRRNIVRAHRRRSRAQRQECLGFPHSVAWSGIRKDSRSRLLTACLPGLDAMGNDRRSNPANPSSHDCLGPGRRDDPGSDGTGIGRIQLSDAGVWREACTIFHILGETSPFPARRHNIVTFISATARLGTRNCQLWAGPISCEMSIASDHGARPTPFSVPQVPRPGTAVGASAGLISLSGHKTCVLLPVLLPLPSP